MKRYIGLILCFGIILSLAVLPAAASEVIHFVGLVDVDLPKLDYKADYDISAPDNSGYYIDENIDAEGYIDGVKWLNITETPAMGKDDTYVVGTYLLSVCLRPKDGYSFSSGVEGYPLHGVTPELVAYPYGDFKGCLILNYRLEVTSTVYADLDALVVPEGSGTVTGLGAFPVGSSVRVTAHPNTGYEFYSWSSEDDIVLSEEQNYTFTITEDTVLICDFKKAPFEDIGGDAYYYDAVVWAVEEGITTGTSATTFSPEKTCTRGQVVTFLHRSAGSPWPHSPISPFTDVTGGEYYYDAVMWAVGSSITTGTSATTFSPDKACTRAQVVTFLWRANGCPEPQNANNPFTDVAPGTYYYDAVLWAVERGVTTGTSATTFSPDKTCTRGQIVTFLYRFTETPVDDGPELEIVYQYPSYTEQPGETAKFYVVVGGGTEPYTYEWQYTRDGMDGYASLLDIEWATGANTDTLRFYVDTDDFDCHFFYRCKITDSKGKTVYSEPVYIIEPLRIATHPSDVYCNVGDTVTFEVDASGGTAPYTYRWQYTNYSADEWYDFINEEWAANYFTDTLTLYVSEDDFTYSYRYRCVVTDADGSEVISYEVAPLQAMG